VAGRAIQERASVLVGGEQLEDFLGESGVARGCSSQKVGPSRRLLLDGSLEQLGHALPVLGRHRNHRPSV
jgi:hypothetical protein